MKSLFSIATAILLINSAALADSTPVITIAQAAQIAQQDLESRGIAVGIYHPGLVATEMIGGYGDISPDEAAQRLRSRIDELDLKNSGCFYHSNGEYLPW